MAREYVTDPADFTPNYPTTPMSAGEWLDPDYTGFAHVDSHAVPAATPYVVALDYVPLAQQAMTVTVDAAPRTVIPFGETPTTSQVAVSFSTGLIKYNAADAGGAAVVTYTAKGSAFLASDLIRIEGELIATQEQLDTVSGSAVADFVDLGDTPGTLGTGNQLIRVHPAGGSLQFFDGSSVYAGLGHSHTAANVTDFSEAVDDRVNGLLSVGSSLTKSYNDAGDNLTLGLGNDIDVDALVDGAGDRWAQLTADFASDGHVNIGDVDSVLSGTRINLNVPDGEISIYGEIATSSMNGEANHLRNVKAYNFADSAGYSILKFTSGTAITSGTLEVGDCEQLYGDCRISFTAPSQLVTVNSSSFVVNGNATFNDNIVAKSNVALGNVAAVTSDTVYVKGENGGSTHAPTALRVEGGLGGTDMTASPFAFDGGGVQLAGGDGNALWSLYFGNGGDIELDGGAAGGGTANNGAIKLGTNQTSRIIISTEAAPASASAAGEAGEVRFDSNYMYRCVATNTWKRTAISTW